MAFSIIWSIEGGIEQITATHVQHLETLLSQTLYIQPSTSNSSSLRLMSGRRRIWLSRVCFRCVYIGPHAYLTSYVWHNTRSRWIESLERKSIHAHMFPSRNTGKEYDVDAKISSIEFTHMRIQDARNLEPLSVCTHTEAQIVPHVEQASSVHIRLY